MSNFDYDSATATTTPTIGDEEPIYLSSSDEDENVPKYTQASVSMDADEQDDDAEPISDDEINDNNNEEDDDEDSYIPTAKSSLSHNPNGSDEDESDHSDTDYDGPYGGGEGRRRPIKVYDEYDPENLDMDDDEASPNAKYRAMRRGLTNAGKPTMRTTMFSSYQVNKFFIFL